MYRLKQREKFISLFTIYLHFHLDSQYMYQVYQRYKVYAGTKSYYLLQYNYLNCVILRPRCIIALMSFSFSNMLVTNFALIKQTIL